VIGTIATYGYPRKGDELVGFSQHGIRFLRKAFPDVASYAQKAPAPLKYHRTLRDAASGEIWGIELQASSQQQVKIIRSPDSDPPAARLVTYHTLTRVNIVPNRRDPSRGKMWVIHEEDVHGGMMYVIQLRCTLRPNLFPKEQ